MNGVTRTTGLALLLLAGLGPGAGGLEGQPTGAPPAEPVAARGFVPLSEAPDVGRLATVADVGYRRVTRREVLESLAARAGLSLTYGADLPGLEESVTVVRWGATLAAALAAALEGSDLRMMVSSRGLAVLVERPRGRVVGSVGDAVSGRPVPGCLVRVAGDRGLSVETDGAGRFVLESLTPGAVTLTFTAPGYDSTVVEDARVPEGGEVTLRVSLGPRAVPLPEMVITPGRFGVLTATGGSAAFSRDEARRAPQLGEEVLRVAERVPGVSSDDVTARLSVRGAWPDELRIVLDGRELYEPYHLQDVDAALSIVDIDALESVELVAGGAAAEHADAIGGVLDLRTSSGPGRGRAALGLSVSSVGGLGEGSFAGARGRWLLSARRGYLDLLLRLGGTDDPLRPRYHDVLGKVEYRTGERSALSAHVLHARDGFRWGEGEEGETARSSWGSRYGWLTWRLEGIADLYAVTSLSTVRLDRDRRGSGFLDPGQERFTVDDVRSFDEAALRQDWSWRAGPLHLLRWGFEVRRQEASYDYSRTGDARLPAPEPGRPTRSGVDVTETLSGTGAGAWAAWRLRPFDPLTLEGGLRWDRFAATDESRVSPRLNAVLSLGSRSAVRASWGRYLGAQRLDQLEVEDGVADLRRPERATQLVVGVERTLAPEVSLRVEGYRRTVADPRPVFMNLHNALDVFPEAAPDRIRLDPTAARARGLEVSLRGAASDRAWMWRAAWVLAEAVDRVGGVDVPRPLDQRHTLQLDGAWSPEPEWLLSASWRFHTGWPTTERRFALAPLGDGRTVATSTFGAVNGERLPAYHRLDLRVSRVLRVGENGRLELFFDVFNAYGRENARGLEYDVAVEEGVLRVREELNPMLPRLPTAGVRWSVPTG